MKQKFPFRLTDLSQVVPVFEKNLAAIQQSFSDSFFSQQIYTDLKLCFVEAIANAAKHADELTTHGCVTGHFFLTPTLLGFEVKDHGHGFSLETVPLPDFNQLLSSGRGIFMMKQLSDILVYKKHKTHHKLIFSRYLSGTYKTPELDLLYELSEAVLGQLHLSDVYQIILNRALDLFGVERASILVYDEQIKKLKLVASKGLTPEVNKNITVQPGEGVSGFVFQHGKPVLIADIDTNQQGIEKKQHYKSRSFMSVPMIISPAGSHEKPWGVINLTDRLNGKPFQKKDLKLLSTIANQAMACVHINHLVQKNQQAETLRQELETLRQIQKSYLPIKAPAIKGLSVAGFCEMVDSVGGDYFDFIHKGEFLFVVIADVSGHDIRSAMTMLNFRSQLHMVLNFTTDPAQALSQLNKNLLVDLEPTGQFVSCVLLRLHLDQGDFLLANAGHPLPLFLSDPQKTLQPSGLVLGLDGTEIYQNTSGRLAEGDGIILHTDGVTEARGDQQQLFGVSRLAGLVRHLKNESSQKIIDDIIAAVLEFRAQGASLDDLTVVCLRRNGKQ